jgi:hypothetical protein
MPPMAKAAVGLLHVIISLRRRGRRTLATFGLQRVDYGNEQQLTTIARQ